MSDRKVIDPPTGPVAEVLQRLKGVKRSGSGWTACCPAHEDHHPSLTIGVGVGGRVLLNCKAGCRTEDVVRALGLAMNDLFVPTPGSNGNGKAHKPPSTPRRQVAAYDYKDADGQLLYQVVRYQPKDFRQRRPDGRSGWVWNLEGVPRVLYRLPDLLNAFEDRPDDWVFVAEGEKDVDRLWREGLIATTNVGGAGRWRDEDAEVLRGRNVAVIPDNDDVGREHAMKIATSLHGKAAKVCVIELPVGPKGDASDFLDRGGDTAAADLILRADAAKPFAPENVTNPPSFRELAMKYPALRPPLIHGILRLGEIMNVIASPKTGKSWMVNQLAISIATGRAWLGLYQVERGDVLILDNELHGETSAHRIPKVAEAMGVLYDEYADHLFVENLRGNLQDVFTLGSYFAGLEPGRFKLIILDAFYRFMPKDMDENDNGTLANVYNHLDLYAARLGCSFVLIHHSSKGSQGSKSVTDVGAGAGAQSRATDTHLVLRQHEEDGVVVLDAAVRSWAPIDPVCLRWDFPIWRPAPDCDPALLRSDGRAKKRREDAPAAAEQEAAAVVWTPELFVERFLRREPQAKELILAKAAVELSARKAQQFLTLAEADGKAFRWTPANPRQPVRFATVEQPVTDTGG